MKKILTLVTVFYSALLYGQVDSAKLMIERIESKMNYQSGEVKLGDDIGTLIVPEQFSYIDSAQATFVIKDLWGNPSGTGTLGMLVPKSTGVAADNAWAFIITYDEMGHVKDDDADDINYNDLLSDMKEDISKENEERVKAGYSKYELVGWASTPFYDKDKKVLHWAKEIKFDGNSNNTLNYNVRILGRKGVLVLNAVSAIDQLGEVKKNIDPVLSSFSYADGNRYSDFNPEIDDVAAWTIGGLVAGKVLAKVGVFAFLLKYIKLIGIALASLGGAAWKWFRRKTEPPVVKDISDSVS